MQPARHPIEAIRAGGPAMGFVLVAVGALVLSYSSLLTLGTRYGFEKGVEYWLFRPTDNAPLVILVLSGWLFYRRWYRVRSLPRSSASLGVIAPCLLLAIALHAWAVYTRADDLKVFSLVLTICSLVLAWWGARGLRALWLPIFFLLFAIPIPAPLLLAIVFKLQIWTASLTGTLLYVLGIPALVSGDQIIRATQTFQVIEGCSGMRSVETLTMLTILLIDLFGRRGWHAVVLLVVAPAIAFLLNGFRVLSLVLNPHSEIIAIHNLQGIAVLLVGLLLVYGIDTLIERRVGAEDPGAWEQPRGDARRPFSLGTTRAVLAVAAIGTAGSTLLSPTWQEPPTGRPSLHAVVASGFAGWPSEKIEPDFEFRGSTRFAEVVHRKFSHPPTPLVAFVGSADLGQRGGSPISAINAVPGSGWMIRDAGWAVVGAEEKPVRSLVVEKGKRRVLAYHWYEGRYSLLAETWRALMALDRSPARRPDALYVVRLETAITGRKEADRVAAAARLDDAYRRLAPQLVEFAAAR